MYKVYEIKQRVFADNDREAEKVREELKRKDISPQSDVISGQWEDNCARTHD